MTSKEGWKNGYKIEILENNWNEERFDSKKIKEMKPILNNENSYGTTYQNMTQNVKSSMDQMNKANRKKNGVLNAFPGHQPELTNQTILTYETDSRSHFLDPKLKMFPINFGYLSKI